MLAITPPLLRGAQVYLRPLALRDADALHPIMADPARMRHWPTPPHGNLATTLAILKGWLAETARGERLAWILANTARGPALGVAAFAAISPPHRRADLVFLLAAEAEGKGLMQDALSRLIAYAATDMRLVRIGADCPAAAARAINLLKRLDFIEEGRRRAYLQHGPHGATDLCLFGRVLSD